MDQIRFRGIGLGAGSRDVVPAPQPAPPEGNFPVAPTHVAWRIEGDTDWQTQAGTAMGVPDTNRVVHTVDLTGLPAGTTVEYRVPDTVLIDHYVTYVADPCSTIRLHWHTPKPQQTSYLIGFKGEVEKTFTARATVSEENPFRLAQISDAHGRTSTDDTLLVIGARDAELLISSGDITTVDGGNNPPNTAYRAIQSYGIFKDTLGRRIPVIPNLGNHECRGGRHGIQWFDQVAFSCGVRPDFENDIRGDTEWYHCFWPGMINGSLALTFGDYLHHYAIDPGISRALDQDHLDEIASEYASVQHIPHRLPTFHYSPYSGGRREMDGSGHLYYTGVRVLLGPVLQAAGVKTAFVGHDHTMTYTVPIDYWEADGHRIERTPAEIGEGIEFYGAGTPNANVSLQPGRNPLTKWWLADSRAREWEYLHFEQSGYEIGNPTGAEIRDPHPDDGTVFDPDDGGHFWWIELTPTQRTIQAITRNNETWVTHVRLADPDMGLT